MNVFQNNQEHAHRVWDVLSRVLAAMIVAVALMQTHAVLAQERVALVIGNSNYQSARQLPNAQNDAVDMMAMLERLDFEVYGDIDLTHDDMSSLIRYFADRAENAEIALVFFAGHGVQADGRNYLIPVDAQLATDRDLHLQAIDMSMLMAALERSRFGLILLDACRNNPFLARMQGANPTRSLGSGLARADVFTRSNLLVSYATHPGGVADDGKQSDRNSPYTTALLKYLPTDMDLHRALAHVVDDVRVATEGMQIPWIEGIPPLNEVRLAMNASTDRNLVPEPVAPEANPVLSAPPQMPPPEPERPSDAGVITTTARAPHTRCDELAANPVDESRLSNVEGVVKANIIWEMAIPACQDSIAQWPHEARLHFQLGRALEVAGRYTEAREAYMAATEYDYAMAISNIGDMHRDGLGSDPSREAAFRWYLRAAELGSTVAQGRVAMAYNSGEGIQQDSQKALSWALILAEKGDWNYMRWVGQYYSDGSQPIDADLGLVWLKKAADQGDTEAMFLIGKRYWMLEMRVDNFAHDFAQREEELHSIAETWLHKAGGYSNPKAAELLRLIESTRACRVKFGFSGDTENYTICRIVGL